MAHSGSKPPAPSVAGPTPRAGQSVSSRSTPARPCIHSSEEASHELEKLEFALAVAITRGDQEREAACRAAIDALGGNREEPGT